MVRHVVQEAQALEQRAATLSEAVERFRLQQGTAVEAVALVERAVALRRIGMAQQQYWQALTDPQQPFHDHRLLTGKRADRVEQGAIGRRLRREQVRTRTQCRPLGQRLGIALLERLEGLAQLVGGVTIDRARFARVAKRPPPPDRERFTTRTGGDE